MSWPIVNLSEVITIDRNSVTPGNIITGTKYVGLENINSDGEFQDIQIVANGELKSNKFQFDSQHILYGKLRPYLRKITRPDFSGICSTDILPIRCGLDMDRNFVYHYLRKQEMIEMATSRCSGANLPRLSPKILLTFKIPKPPLREQKRIAAILDKEDDIKKSITQANIQRNVIINAVFTSLFGDVILNTCEFPTKELADIVSINMGQSPNGESYNETGNGTPFLQGNAEFSSLNPVHKKYTTEPSKMSKKGEILLSIRAPVGEINIADQEYCIGRGLAAIEPNEFMNQEYLQYCLFFMKKVLQSRATGSTFKAVTGKTLKSFEIPIPPIQLQQQFALLISTIRKIDFNKSLEYSTELQNSTIQEMLT